MPLKWVPPDAVIMHRNIIIYHTYKSDDYNNRNTYWFTTDLTEDPDNDCDFDIRELEKYKDISDEENIGETLRNAIDNKALKLPDGIEYIH